MITPIYAALLCLMLIGLSINVIRSRKKFRAGLGDADNIEMRRRIRAQANLAEYAPMFLILLGYAELNGLTLWAVNLFGMIFFAGRLMHAYSLLKAEQYDSQDRITSNPIWRICGMLCTLSTLGFLALVVLMQTTYL